jgi:Flp pilus assembly protein TadG
MTGGARPCWRRGLEDGSLSVELAMIAPALLLIFGLIFAYGRTGQINGTLDSGTRDGARSATTARSYDEARQLATKAIKAAIVDSPQDCQNSLQVRVTGRFEPGEAVTVSADCTFGLSDIGLPGAPGTIHTKATFTSMLDPNRGIQ